MLLSMSLISCKDRRQTYCESGSPVLDESEALLRITDPILGVRVFDLTLDLLSCNHFSKGTVAGE